MPDIRLDNVSPGASARLLQRPALAMGMSLAKIQRLVQVVGDENAPHFLPGQEPVAGGRTYTSTAGAVFYRPGLRVAERGAPSVGPEVRFLKDADGKVRLFFELAEDPDTSMPATAQPLGVRVTDLVLRWNGGERRFQEPTLVVAAPSPDGLKPAFFIRAGAELSAADVETLNGVLGNPGSGARLEVGLTYGFWVDTPTAPSGPDDPATHVVISHGHGRVLTPVSHPGTTLVTLPRPMDGPGAVVAHPGLGTHVGTAVPHGATTVVHPVARAGPAFASTHLAAMMMVNPRVLADRMSLEAAVEHAGQVVRQPNFRNEAYRVSVPFTFDPALDQNRLIYAAIRGADSLTEAWTDTEFGPIRRAPYPNTVHFLPQEIRLAFNPELGTAHVIPNLYRDDHDEVRVRVTLRAASWYDPQTVVALRDHLYRATGGALASPRLVAGGYQHATLTLLTAFPEQIHSLNQELSIDLSTGVDLTLDLSLEFYRFVAELLTGPVGIVGEVRVLLQETAAPREGTPPVRTERTVPLRLRLDRFAGLPLGVSVKQEAVRPDEVAIHNESGGELKVGGCLSRLLQVDSNSVVPLEVFVADVEGTFPRTLAADEVMAVKVKPRDDGASLLWNAVEVSMTDLGLGQTAVQVLDRVHELAPSGTLRWTIRCECPPFLGATVPPQFGNLFRVEVTLSRPGFATQQVVLGRDAAAVSVDMQRSLKDLMGPQGAQQFTFTYRVRNVYFDHLGKWSDEKAGEGSTLFVFPNPPEND